MSRLYGPISNGDYFALDFSRGVVEVPADEAVSFANASFRIEFWLFLKNLSDGGDGEEEEACSSDARRARGMTEHEAALEAAMAFAKQQENDDYGDEVVFSCGVRNPAIAASHSCISVSLERGRSFMCLSLFNDDLKVLTSPEDIGKWVHWSMSFDAESKVLVVMKDGEILGRRSVGAALNRCACPFYSLFFCVNPGGLVHASPNAHNHAFFALNPIRFVQSCQWASVHWRADLQCEETSWL